MGLRLWPWNKRLVFPMEVAWVSTSTNGMAQPQQRQGLVDGFFNHESVIHHQYAPPCQIITKEYYIKVLRWLRDAVRRKQPQLWASGDWQPHHNNALAHSTVLVQVFFFGKTSHHPGLSSPLQPRFGSLRLLAFPKAKIAIERRTFVKATVTQYTSSVNGISLLTD